MASDRANTITLEGDDDSYQRESGEANGTITPGQLLNFDGLETSAGSDEVLVVRNNTDGAVVVPRIALELAKTGKTKEDDYADGDYIEWRVFESGDVALVQVFDGSNAGGTGTDTSDNANISAGDYLVPYSGSGEDGTFRAFDSGDGDAEGQKMFQAVEAQDNSGGSNPAFVAAEKV